MKTHPSVRAFPPAANALLLFRDPLAYHTNGPTAAEAFQIDTIGDGC
jgi:hypothetical protein